jgi:hypothetical protein
MHVEEEERIHFSRLNHLSHCIHSQVSENDILSSHYHGVLGCWDVLPFQKINGVFQDSPSRPFHWWALFVVEGHLAKLITPVSPPVARTHFRISNRLEACNSL